MTEVSDNNLFYLSLMRLALLQDRQCGIQRLLLRASKDNEFYEVVSRYAVTHDPLSLLENTDAVLGSNRDVNAVRKVRSLAALMARSKRLFEYEAATRSLNKLTQLGTAVDWRNYELKDFPALQTPQGSLDWPRLRRDYLVDPQGYQTHLHNLFHAKEADILLANAGASAESPSQPEGMGARPEDKFRAQF